MIYSQLFTHPSIKLSQSLAWTVTEPSATPHGDVINRENRFHLLQNVSDCETQTHGQLHDQEKEDRRESQLIESSSLFGKYDDNTIGILMCSPYNLSRK